MRQVYLIRHAQTTMNIEQRYAGLLDCELSEYGYEQLEQLKEKMKCYDIKECYTSPSKRAKLTAKSFWENPIEVYDLHEMDFGDADGMKFVEVNDKYPELGKKMLKNGDDIHFPNGESQDNMRKRAKKVYDEILSKSKSDSIAIVSHACVIRAIISKEVLGEYSLSWKINIGNASITKLEVYDNSTILSFLNL
ncbi:MAG: histidine phosphatase family protein [Peptostreptococcaceae bacterium]|nr:histidine phosphatase family protein [Peptostreptococcaceae bacterium]